MFLSGHSGVRGRGAQRCDGRLAGEAGGRSGQDPHRSGCRCATVPEHHHRGPTIDYVLSGALRMQLLDGPVLVYQTGQTLFEPPGSVHLYAENPSVTEAAKVMLIHVADDGAQLIVFH
jgi:mannose-6-phosphate isomerase-like protein (cupin superfamily)